MTTGGPIVIFCTQSDVEANVVRGLLETHGVEANLVSDLPHAVFPLSINGLGEVRLSVREEQVETAKQLIADYSNEIATKVDKLRDRFDALETSLGYQFRDKGLLELSLTHRSRAHEDASDDIADNESLEFLGDAVLGLIISDRLFREFPEYDEGRKSKAKALLVSAPTLAQVGEQLGLGLYLLLGRGEEKTGGRQKPSLIADTFEAVLAAVYLDGGVEAADAFIERHFRGALEDVRAKRPFSASVTDYKSSLQEWLQSHDRSLPVYALVSTKGPDHRKLFEVEVSIGGQTIGLGEGRSKKEAEQVAASRALEVLQDEPM